MSIKVYFDGACGPRNPGGTAAYGFVVKDDKEEVIYEGYGRVGSGTGMTSNVAEYASLCHAMRYIREHYRNEEVTFYGDSTLVINQMNGVAKAKKGAYLPFHHDAIRIAADHRERWSFEWVARVFNSEADRLSQYKRCRN